MKFIKVLLNSYPRILFAHSFISKEFGFSNRSEGYMEIVYVDNGEIECTIEKVGIIHAKTGDLLILPPNYICSSKVISNNTMHEHSTVAFLCDYKVTLYEKEEIEGELSLNDVNLMERNMLVLPLHINIGINTNEEKIIKQIIHEFQENKQFSSVMCSGLFLELSSQISRRCYTLLSQINPKEYVTPQNRSYCKQINQYLINNYMYEINIDLVASSIGLHPELYVQHL
jgi:hypothetical protein